MSRKRKRQHARKTVLDNADAKRRRVHIEPLSRDNAIETRLLPFYYSSILTLQEYLITKNARYSKRIRQHVNNHENSVSGIKHLLETTLVGSFVSGNREEKHNLSAKDFQDFTQKCSGTTSTRRISGGTISSSLGDGTVCMSDLVDFTIWRLFHRTYRHIQRPPHVICHGWSRSNAPKAESETLYDTSSIHGLTHQYRNSQLERLKGHEWVGLCRLLGKDGDQIMLELLLECGIFVPVENGKDNYLQLSGTNLAEMPLIDAMDQAQTSNLSHTNPISNHGEQLPRTPANVSFVRSRMFYARAALNARGEVHFGLRHIHVLNRYPDYKDSNHAAHILKYMFPLQFSLHNVFTSTVDKKETSHAFKDYTLREHEIATWHQRNKKQASAKVPRRLRGTCVALVQKMQLMQKKCPYKELLKHYCAVHEIDQPRRRKARRSSNHSNSGTQLPSAKDILASDDGDGKQRKSFVDLATPAAHVFAFVQAVICKVLPRAFLGIGNKGLANWDVLSRAIERFIQAKRYESMRLDSVCKGIKPSSVDWLASPKATKNVKMPLSDLRKRQELLQELLYYVFDSIVIPLVRANFHVTESNDHKYRLFYFRHDVWRALTEPAIARIKTEMYQELPTAKARALLDRRALGHSHIRLLPKKSTVRPITNLKRRAITKRYGKTYLGSSINSTLKNVFSMLNYEKMKQPNLLRSSIFSVNELYSRIKGFRARLQQSELLGAPLYFVKVDVKSCFDTIPQQAVLELIERLCGATFYRVKHHTEVKAVSPFVAGPFRDAAKNKPTKRFLRLALASDGSQDATFSDLVEKDYATGRRSTVFAEAGLQNHLDTEELLDLLDDHVRRNIVRIGKKYFRQKRGIPQGSILSSLLCSFFYADFENQKLGFLHASDAASEQGASMLVRLIDDFLLVTTEKGQAERFLRVMLDGDEAYGITVRPEKTLLNFTPGEGVGKFLNPQISAICSGNKSRTEIKPLQVVARGSMFPWCGTLIDTRNLALTRDRHKGMRPEPMTKGSLYASVKVARRPRTPDLADSITLEVHRRPGAAFYRKTLAAVRLNVRKMYTDTSVATSEQVRGEIFVGLVEVAERAGRYLSRLGSVRGSSSMRTMLLKTTIKDVANMTVGLTKTNRTEPSKPQVPANVEPISKYRCDVSKTEIEHMTVTAFLKVLQRQQTKYIEIVMWLKEWKENLRSDRRNAGKRRRITASW